MDASSVDCKRLLRSLELKAFRGVVDALRAQGSLTTYKHRVLKNLASALKVNDDRCRSEMRRASNDNFLNCIAQCSNETDTEENWRIDSARRIARVPMITHPTVFTALADSVSDWVISQNQPNAENGTTLIEVLESKKNRMDANASRYHTTKLIASLRPTRTTIFNDIAAELEKLKCQQKEESSKNVPRSCVRSSSSTAKPNRAREKPYIPGGILENLLNKVQSDDDDVRRNRTTAHNSVPASNSNVEVGNSEPRDAVLPTKSRKPSQKHAQTSKMPNALHDLVEERSSPIMVTHVDAPSVPVAAAGTESAIIDRKRPLDSCREMAAVASDVEWRPIEKKMRIDSGSASKISSTIDNTIERVSSIVSVKDVADTKSSSLVSDPAKRRMSVDEPLQASTDLSTTKNQSKEVPSQPLRPTIHFAQLKACTVVEKDFTPHTFNLIPASRRLKLVKKMEQSAVPFAAKGNEAPVSVARSDNTSLPVIKTEQLNDNEQTAKSVADIAQRFNNFVSSFKKNQSASIVAQCERNRENEAKKGKNIAPVLNQTKKTLSLLGNIKVRNLNAKAEDELLEDCCSSDEFSDGADFEEEEDDMESESERCVTDLSSLIDDLSEYSDVSLDEADSPNIIEYYDDDEEEEEEDGDDDDVVDINVNDELNGVRGDRKFVKNHRGPEKKGSNFENGIVFEEEDCVVGDKNNARLCDRASLSSQYSDEIVEEIVEDDEYLSSEVDFAGTDGDDDVKRLRLNSTESSESSTRSEKKLCSNKVEPIQPVKKIDILTSNHFVPSAAPSAKLNSACVSKESLVIRKNEPSTTSVVNLKNLVQVGSRSPKLLEITCEAAEREANLASPKVSATLAPLKIETSLAMPKVGITLAVSKVGATLAVPKVVTTLVPPKVGVTVASPNSAVSPAVATTSRTVVTSSLTTAAAGKGAAVVLSSPKVAAKIVSVGAKTVKKFSPSFTSSKSTTTGRNVAVASTTSKCVVGGQTISISNARLVGATIATTAAVASTSASSSSAKSSLNGPLAAHSVCERKQPNSTTATAFPKIKVYSSKMSAPQSGGLLIPPGAPKRIVAPQVLKTVGGGADISSQKSATVKSFHLPLPKNVCRLYNLIDVSESAATVVNSSSSILGGAAKKTQTNKKSFVNVSST